MKALVDTNVLITYLLAPESSSTASHVIRNALHGQFAFVIGSTCIQELERSVTQKSWLASRIDRSNLDAFVGVLRQFADIVKPHERLDKEAISRDPDDDVVLLDAAFAEVDFLVTGDADLLVLEHFAGVRIVTPADFLAILDT